MLYMSLEEVEKLKKTIKSIKVRVAEAEQIVGNILTGAVEYPEKASNVYRIDTKALREYSTLCNKKIPIGQIVLKFDDISRASLYVIIENAGRKNSKACMAHVALHYNVLLGIKKTLEQINF